MKARLKSDYIYPAMRACGGTMFNKIDWTDVPPEHEKSAVVNADLEVQPTASEYLDAIVPAPAAKAHLKAVAQPAPAPVTAPSPTELVRPDPYTDLGPEISSPPPIQAAPELKSVKPPVKKARGK